MIKLPNLSFHDKYFDEIDKLKEIAKLQHAHKLITTEEFNETLFTLYDKFDDYKRNLTRINIPKIEVKNFRNININLVIESLLSTG